jgi:hypothetical protein
MSDRYDEDRQHLIVDGIDDPIIACSNPVKVVFALQFLCTVRARVLREQIDMPSDALLR